MAASVGNAVGVAGGISKHFEGKRMQKRAQKFIDNFEWQDLKAFSEDEQVSTLGSDLKTEQANMGAATQTEALRTGGQRALVGGLGKVEAGRNIVNQENAANLDQKQATINAKIADQKTQNQATNEKRQGDELAGYGQMLNTGMGMKYGGLADIQASGQAQSQHNMELFETFGSSAMASDRKLKENIVKIGVSPSGLNIYNFEYIDNLYGEGVYQGVMSDEIPKEAIVHSNKDFDMVDYSKLDVEFKKVI